MPEKNKNSQPTFVTIMNGYHIFKLSENSFQAVKRSTNISQKVEDSFTRSTLLETVTEAMKGQKLVANQLQRVRSAVMNFARNELGAFVMLSRA